MMTGSNRKSNAAGFTLVEMLVTLFIIGVILAMVLPAFNMVKAVANEVRQKSQFSNIEMALEGFRADFGDYPESAPSYPLEAVLYGGAQKLAEAVVGQDGFGVHNKTAFQLNGAGDFNNDGAYDVPDEYLYDITTGNNFETPAENKAARRGPYLELESANAVRLGSIYLGLPSPQMEPSLVLGDKFGLVKNMDTSKKTGMPVLYYKADTTSVYHRPEGDWASYDDGTDDNIYSVNHNQGFLGVLAPPFKDGRTHPLKDPPGRKKFYEMTRNPNFVGGTDRPYRAESFLLHSAGPDGLYGSPDDLFNFDPGK